MENKNQHYQSKFKRLLAVQLILLVIGGVAFVYISMITTKEMNIYRDIRHKKDSLNAQYEELQKDYESLRANVKEMYATEITPENEIYEVDATAAPTGKFTSDRKPIQNFKVFINAAEAGLQKIQKVVYHFDHPTLQNKIVESVDRENQFAVGYIGWGCLTNIPIEIYLTDSVIQKIDFDMCKSIEKDRAESLKPSMVR